MAGHSKWANIQHRKGRQDAKRGKLFTKLIREITVATKIGGSDSSSNPRLRAAIDNALSNNMTKDTVERAVKRSSGDSGCDNVNEIRYEGYIPGGIAIMVDTMTDNRNRTVAEVRHIFTKFGGNLGTDGSVAYLFTKVGIISYSAKVGEDDITEAALESNAKDIVINPDGSIDVFTDPDSFFDVKDSLIKKGFKPESSEITMHASIKVKLDIENSEKMLNVIDMMEDLDDVQSVYTNAEIDDDILAQIKR